MLGDVFNNIKRNFFSEGIFVSFNQYLRYLEKMLEVILLLFLKNLKFLLLIFLENYGYFFKIFIFEFNYYLNIL